MPKLIYVYEDVNFEGSKHELVQCSYFWGDYAGTEGTGQLWREVFAYIKESYDEDALKKIYINGDGADWIRAGAGMHAKAHFVLDRFHIQHFVSADKKDNSIEKSCMGIVREEKSDIVRIVIKSEAGHRCSLPITFRQ